MQNKNTPIFIINLKKDIEKKQHMQKLCQKYNLEVEFIEAVYGKELSQEAIDAIYSEQNSIKEIGRSLSSGELGCLLSHRTIYQRMISENIPEAIILEDDIEFNEKFINFLIIKDNLPRDAELLLLGYWYSGIKYTSALISFHNRMKISQTHEIVRFTKKMHGTYAYYITIRGAKKILSSLDNNITMPIDHYTGDENIINLYGIYPAIVKLSDSFSIDTDLQNERLLLRNKFTSNKIRYDKIKKTLNSFGLLGLIRVLLLVILKTKKYLLLFWKQMKILKEYN